MRIYSIILILVLAAALFTVLGGCKKAAEKQIETGAEMMGELMKGEAKSMQNAAEQAGKETIKDMTGADEQTVETFKKTAGEIADEAKKATKEASEKAQEAYKDVKKLFGN